jgi:hypothetical protein
MDLNKRVHGRKCTAVGVWGTVNQSLRHAPSAAWLLSHGTEAFCVGLFDLLLCKPCSNSSEHDYTRVLVFNHSCSKYRKDDGCTHDAMCAMCYRLRGQIPIEHFSGGANSQPLAVVLDRVGARNDRHNSIWVHPTIA